MGESLVEDDFLEQARRVMSEAEEKGVRLLLPADVIVAERFEADSPAKRVSVKDVPEGWRIMDVGETTIDVFARALQDCKMVVWNGPMGVIEMGPFAHGSHRLAGVIANLREATTIIGGGETAAVVEQLGLAEPLLAREHGWRSVAGVPGGEGAAGGGGVDGCVVSEWTTNKRMSSGSAPLVLRVPQDEREEAPRLFENR